MSLVYSVVQSSFHDPQGKAFTHISKRFRPHFLVATASLIEFIVLDVLVALKVHRHSFW